jgi:hypothetical protein
MLIDSMFADAPGFQRNRIRDQFIGYTTAASPDVLLWSIHRDRSTNAPHEFPLGSVVGCDIVGGPTTCIGVNGPNSFRIRHDVLFAGGVAKKGTLDPCAQLRADFRFAPLNPCPQGGTLAEQ